MLKSKFGRGTTHMLNHYSDMKGETTLNEWMLGMIKAYIEDSELMKVTVCFDSQINVVYILYSYIIYYIILQLCNSWNMHIKPDSTPPIVLASRVHVATQSVSSWVGLQDYKLKHLQMVNQVLKILASSVDRYVHGGRKWLRQWFQTLKLSFTF